MYEDLLIHTVEVRRRSGQKDRFRQPVEPRGNRYADRVYMGRLDAGSGGERHTDRTRDVVEFTHKLFLEAGAELYEADQVTVTDGRGTTLVTMADVQEVQTFDDDLGPHHVEAKIKAVRSGEPTQ